MITNKVVHRVKNRGDHGFLFKVDFHKPFDSVLWDYLDDVMVYIGFGILWRSLVKECVSSSKMAILINELLGRKFSLQRGLRQGDLLSPFLFDIIVEGPSVLFSLAINAGYFKGLKADDAWYTFISPSICRWHLFFSPNDYSSLLHVKRILHWFALISGLWVNYFKSSLIEINLDDDYISWMASSFSCRGDTFPVKYLRLPMGANPFRLSTWKPIISNIRSRLASWKGKMLSIAGRISLIKSVLNSLPLFYMPMFLVFKDIIGSISTIIRKFFWSGSLDTFKMCKVAWFKVIQPKNGGGLGLGSLYNKSMTLLLKWIWHLEVGNSGG